MTLHILSGAESEYAEALLYYFGESPQAAGGFIEAIDAGFAEILDHPMMYRIHVGTVRVKNIDVYPFCIYYRIKEEEIEVVSISHNSRKPEHWLDRL